MITLPVGFVAAATVLSLLGMAATSPAVDVHIMAVQASPQGPSDPRLLEYRARLRRLVGYRSFRIVHEERQNCAWQSRAAFSIPGGRVFYVLPKGMRDETVMMQVQLLDGARALVDTDVRLQNRGVMLFGVEALPRAGGALIIMLKAEE